MPNLTKNTRKLIIDLFLEGYAVVDLSHIYDKPVSVIEEVLRVALIQSRARLEATVKDGERMVDAVLKQAVKGG